MTARRRSAPTERRNREAEVTDAAVTVFYERGYAAASLQDVADIVGVLKGSLYHYIDSKEDLLFRVCTRSHEQASEIMQQAVDEAERPFDQMRHFLATMADWYLNNVERVSIYFNEGRWLTGDRRAQVRQQQREFHDFLRNLIEKSRADGSLSGRVDARLAAHLILGSLNSVSSWYRPDGLYGPEEVRDAFVASALASLD